MIKTLRHQQGSMLVLAIFILTVMFLLAAALIHISENEDESVLQEVMGERALLAANSGADAALAKLFPLTVNGSSNCSVVKLPSTWTIPTSAETLQTCTVSLGCESFSDNSGGQTLTQYRITSKAVCGEGTNHRTSRQVEVIARY